MNPYQVIKTCEETKGKKAKIAILKEHGSDLLQSVIYNALNPYIVFNVKKFEFEEPCEHTEEFTFNWNHAVHMLGQLSARDATGNDALQKIKEASANLNSGQQDVLRRILKKNLDCGVNVKTANEAFPDLIPTFDVQLAKPVNYDRLEFPVLVEPKLDGIRTIAFVDKKIEYFSRNGRKFENFGMFDIELAEIGKGQGIVIDGEVTGTSQEKAFKGVTTQARRKENVDVSNLKYHIFDYITIPEFKKMRGKFSQAERTAELKKMFYDADERETYNVKLVKGKICNNIKQVEKYYQKCLKKGYEGVILKTLTALYQFKRTYDWSKIKPTETKDLKITEAVEGEGKYKGMLGAFLVDNKGTIVHVGGGYNDEQRAKFWKDRKKMIGTVIEVKYDSETEDGSFRFPRFVKVRLDKTKKKKK